jgi:hypothetical protein
MPLYSELLLAALADSGPGSGSPDPGRDDLVAALLVRGQRLRAARSPIERLALELDYDVTLVRLCRTVPVPADPERFDPPARAREDLEGRLRSAGVAVPGVHVDPVPLER